MISVTKCNCLEKRLIVCSCAHREYSIESIKEWFEINLPNGHPCKADKFSRTEENAKENRLKEVKEETVEEIPIPPRNTCGSDLFNNVNAVLVKEEKSFGQINMFRENISIETSEYDSECNNLSLDESDDEKSKWKCGVDNIEKKEHVNYQEEQLLVCAKKRNNAMTSKNQCGKANENIREKSNTKVARVNDVSMVEKATLALKSDGDNAEQLLLITTTVEKDNLKSLKNSPVFGEEKQEYELVKTPSKEGLNEDVSRKVE